MGRSNAERTFPDDASCKMSAAGDIYVLVSCHCQKSTLNNTRPLRGCLRCRDGSIQYTAITLNKKRQHLVKNRITMKKTKFIIATLACFAAARTLNVTRQRASKPRETIDLIRQERTDCDSKMPGPVMADIWLRATHIGPVLEGILNEPHTEARRAFN